MTSLESALRPERAAPKTIKVHARDEDFRIVQLLGNLLVCTRANGSCCCGWTEKGRAPVNIERYQLEWEGRKLRNKVHLTFAGCLGPCAVGNNALLQLYGRSIWFKDLNDDALIPMIFDYMQAMLAAGNVLPPPASLVAHVYERYLPPPEGSYTPLVADAQDDAAGLERLDPVCLMEVDPATAKWKSEYNGRTYYFCAPSCKKAFERAPEEYV